MQGGLADILPERKEHITSTASRPVDVRYDLENLPEVLFLVAEFLRRRQSAGRSG